MPNQDAPLLLDLADKIGAFHAIGSSATFWVFAAFSVIGWVWVYIYVPETRGQSLEQIQGIWKGLRK